MAAAPCLRDIRVIQAAKGMEKTPQLSFYPRASIVNALGTQTKFSLDVSSTISFDKQHCDNVFEHRQVFSQENSDALVDKAHLNNGRRIVPYIVRGYTVETRAGLLAIDKRME